MSGNDTSLAEDVDWTNGISTACSSATTAIAKTSPALRLFIREVREARPDLDAVLAELNSLEGVVDILRDDAAAFPSDLAKRTPPLLQHCTSIVDQIAGYLHVCDELSLSKRDKKFRWLAIRADMVKLRMTLEGYKSILAVVTDLVGLNKTRRENDALSIHSNAHALEDQTATNDDIRTELTHVMADMGTLRGRLQGDFRSNYAVADLESYLDAMQLDATNLGYRMNAGYRRTNKSNNNSITVLPLSENSPAIPRKSADRGSCVIDAPPSNGTSSSVGDEPDSAIDINDGPPSPFQPSPTKSTHAQDENGHPLPPNVSSLPIVQIDEFLDELSSEPSRAPTPPPRARARGLTTGHLGSIYSKNLAAPDNNMVRPPSTRSISVYSAVHDTGSPLMLQRSRSVGSYAGSDADGDARSTLGDLMNIRPAFTQSDYNILPCEPLDIEPIAITPLAVEPIGPLAQTIPKASSTFDEMEKQAPAPVLAPSASVFTGIEKGTRRLFGRTKSYSVAARPTRPGSSDGALGTRKPGHSRSISLLLSAPYGQNTAMFMTPSMTPSIPAANRPAPSPSAYAPNSATPTPRPSTQHNRHASNATAHTVTTITSTSSGSGSASKCPIRATTSNTAASIRSNSSRISSAFSRVTSWRPSKSFRGESTVEDSIDLEPDDIFGVSLKKSMQMASAAVRTHHDGSKASSRREFPRCILACSSFIKENNGVATPNIFGGSGGDFGMGFMGGDPERMARVAALKEAFSAAPYYGEDLDWAPFDVHDAAELIVLFLQQLPKPLVTETVAKRWIVLSRQATLPGSMGMRLDACIDFWDEALLGVRGPARSMFKLLLNLWGDVADAAEVNDMTAERLAARLLNPLMHLPPGKYTTDYMLGLAFLIRKRSEYAIMLRDGRKSKAAF